MCSEWYRKICVFYILHKDICILHITQKYVQNGILENNMHKNITHKYVYSCENYALKFVLQMLLDNVYTLRVIIKLRVKICILKFTQLSYTKLFWT